MTIWQTKLAARIHDPSDKALVLLRDPPGHECGTSRALARLLGLSEALAENINPANDEMLSVVIFKKGLPRGGYEIVRRAGWWAAGRPQWSMQAFATQAIAAMPDNPEKIHPFRHVS